MRSGLVPTRRRKPLLRFGEPVFTRLVRAPGLKPLPGGQWVALSTPTPLQVSSAGRPSIIEGERHVALRSQLSDGSCAACVSLKP